MSFELVVLAGSVVAFAALGCLLVDGGQVLLGVLCVALALLDAFQFGMEVSK